MFQPAAADLSAPWADSLRFAACALTAPRRIGAVLPSGPVLARTLARLARGPRIVELGPGTGCVTRPLLAGLGGRDHVLALELDPRLAEALGRRLRHPRLLVRGGDAADLDRWLDDLGWGHADTIVSCLPFQALPNDRREAVLAASRRALGARGRFIAFQYGLRLLPLFRAHFTRVRVLGPVWANLPPAYVIVARP